MTDLQVIATTILSFGKQMFWLTFFLHTSLLRALKKPIVQVGVVVTFEVCIQEVPTSELGDITCHP
jgi:hypothetical protein